MYEIGAKKKQTTKTGCIRGWGGSKEHIVQYGVN